MFVVFQMIQKEKIKNIREYNIKIRFSTSERIILLIKIFKRHGSEAGTFTAKNEH